MRKYILAILTFLFLFILSGCGSNSKPDGDTTPTPDDPIAVEMQNNYIVQDESGINFTLAIPITKKLDSGYLVKLNGYGLTVNGCTMSTTPSYSPATLTLNGAKNSVETLYVTGTFDQKCTVAGYTFTATQTVTGDSNVDTRPFSATFDYSNPDGETPGIPTDGYAFFNATTPLEITQASTAYDVKVQVLLDAHPAVGKIVGLQAFPSIYGDVSSYNVTTGDDGYATFAYTSPKTMPANGSITELKLDFKDENNATITQDILLTFNSVGGGVDTNVSVPVVVISNAYENINLTSNSQNVQMEIQVFEKGTNTPFTTGNVKVSLPDSVLTGTDVGSFTEYIVPVGANGRATFNYTGPQDLQSLDAAGETGASFAFYHEENSESREGITVTYDLSSGYIPANYVLTTSSADGNQTMGLQIMKTFTLYVKDDQGTLVDDADITQIVIESKNTLVGKLVDAANGGANVPVLPLNGVDAVNSKSFPVQTYTLSGLLPIEITVTFNDANGASTTLTLNMNIVVFSGPPTAMSISYAGVEQNSTIAKYIEKFAVTVTDAYNNPINTKPYVAVGSMVEYAVDGSSVTGTRNTASPRLWHGSNDSYGDLKGIGGNKAQFETATDIFKYVDFSNDKLVIFGSGFVYEALGKWDIKYSGSDNILDLKDDYSGSDRIGLFYAVGHNNRQDLCAMDARQYVGNMKATNYQLDDNGHALIEFEYDYHLTGKDIMVWVNLTGFQADNGNTGRIGEAKKHTLRGAGFTSPEGYSLKSGDSGQFRFTIEHENTSEVYSNGHFSTATLGACTVTSIIDYSNNYDARECSNTKGYIELDVINRTDKDCTIQLDDASIVVTPEFNGVSRF